MSNKQQPSLPCEPEHVLRASHDHDTNGNNLWKECSVVGMGEGGKGGKEEKAGGGRE